MTQQEQLAKIYKQGIICYLVVIYFQSQARTFFCKDHASDKINSTAIGRVKLVNQDQSTVAHNMS